MLVTALTHSIISGSTSSDQSDCCSQDRDTYTGCSKTERSRNTASHCAAFASPASSVSGSSSDLEVPTFAQLELPPCADSMAQLSRDQMAAGSASQSHSSLGDFYGQSAPYSHSSLGDFNNQAAPYSRSSLGDFSNQSASRSSLEGFNAQFAPYSRSTLGGSSNVYAPCSRSSIADFATPKRVRNDRPPAMSVDSLHEALSVGSLKHHSGIPKPLKPKNTESSIRTMDNNKDYIVIKNIDNKKKTECCSSKTNSPATSFKSRRSVASATDYSHDNPQPVPCYKMHLAPPPLNCATRSCSNDRQFTEDFSASEANCGEAPLDTFHHPASSSPHQKSDASLPCFAPAVQLAGSRVSFKSPMVSSRRTVAISVPAMRSWSPGVDRSCHSFSVSSHAGIESYGYGIESSASHAPQQLHSNTSTAATVEHRHSTALSSGNAEFNIDYAGAGMYNNNNLVMLQQRRSTSTINRPPQFQPIFINGVNYRGAGHRQTSYNGSGPHPIHAMSQAMTTTLGAAGINRGLQYSQCKCNIASYNRAVTALQQKCSGFCCW